MRHDNQCLFKRTPSPWVRHCTSLSWSNLAFPSVLPPVLLHGVPSFTFFSPKRAPENSQPLADSRQGNYLETCSQDPRGLGPGLGWGLPLCLAPLLEDNRALWVRDDPTTR